MKHSHYLILICLFLIQTVSGQNYSEVDRYAKEVEKTVIDLRRSFHQFPELSNREFETAKKIAQIMTQLGFKVETGIAHTGVVAVMDTGRPGPTVGLRADMDALPITEDTGLPFASTAKGEYLGEEVGVMHACGHDAHMAMLIGAASVINKMKDKLSGKVVFIFQPAEEGAPPGEEGGAELMVKQGIMEKYGIDVVFGQHVRTVYDSGTIHFKVGGIMAAANKMTIVVKGEGTHGSRPWRGVDPVTVSAQIILGLQNIVSRQMDITNEPVVISIGKIQGGLRNNIIPDEVTMVGTIRTFDTLMQRQVHAKIIKTAKSIAESAGATADVRIESGYPVTVNDAALVREMIPSLYGSAGEQNVRIAKASPGAEDFSYFAQKVPGLFYFLGIKPKDISVFDATNHHSPGFYVDETALVTGVKTLSNLAIDYLQNNSK